MTHARAMMLCFAAVLMLSPGPALASTGQLCDPTMIGFNQDSTGTNIYLACAQDSTSHTYVAYSTNSPPNPCSTTVGIDTLKVYQSMLISARLSGKTATVWWDTCGGSSSLRQIAAINF